MSTTKDKDNSRTIPAEVSSTIHKGNKRGKGEKVLPKELTDAQQALIPELVAVNSSRSIQKTGELGFYPSKKQRLFLDTALKADKHEITAVAKEAGLSRSAWYEWIKDDKFVGWYNESWQKALDAQAWRLDAMGLKKASDDHKYWKSMQQRSGRLIEGGNNTQVNIAGFNVDFITDDD